MGAGNTEYDKGVTKGHQQSLLPLQLLPDTGVRREFSQKHKQLLIMFAKALRSPLRSILSSVLSQMPACAGEKSVGGEGSSCMRAQSQQSASLRWLILGVNLDAWTADCTWRNGILCPAQLHSMCEVKYQECILRPGLWNTNQNVQTRVDMQDIPNGYHNEEENPGNHLCRSSMLPFPYIIQTLHAIWNACAWKFCTLK